MKLPHISLWLLIIVLAVTSQACGVAQETSPVATESAQQSTPSAVELSTFATPTSDIQERPPTAASTPTPSVNITQTSTLPIVTVTAMNGNVAIRTGPDTVFDAVAALNEGETVTALARSILDGWLQVPIPTQPGETGWVSTKTSYSIVSGNVLDLPRIDVVEWPTGSYLINCTTHQLIVQPGDKTLQPVTDSPGNRAWFSPGVYKVYDMDVEEQPEITTIKLYSHTEVQIVTDGNRQRSECPTPNDLPRK
jgi:hypothetical protein